MVKLDLGCGEWPKEGFIGIDNSEINPINLHKFKPNILHDLNRGIPFKDNEVEEVYCSHLLEHVKNPYFILDEIYRVCKNRAGVVIIVPLLEIFNPYHKTMFFSDWFERNLDKSKFIIKNKKIETKEVSEKVNEKRCFYELRIELGVIK